MFVHAARLQLAVSIALCGAVAATADVLIPAWLRRGGFEQSALLTQLLAYVVITRAWTAMPSTILKGTGRPRFVAIASSCCALANVLLSVVLVNTFGLTGVAIGTVIPVTVLAAAVLFPAGCHAVGLSTWEGYRRVVWPAAWPAIVFAGVAAARHAVPQHVAAVLALMAFGVLVYAALFFAAGLERDERRWCATKLADVWRRRAQVIGLPLRTGATRAM
jgi:O-antigen/teichoic acid export membrane protein